jgi:hypothetical protein
MRTAQYFGLAGVIFISLSLISCGNSNPSVEEVDGSPVKKTSEQSIAVKYDGPFGLAFGLPIDKLDVMAGVSDDGDGVYILSSVPKPMSELETYGAMVYPGAGLCELRTISKKFDSDAYGTNIKPAIDNLAEIISSKYGKAKKLDYCNENYCKFFQMGLKNGASAYGYQWKKNTGAILPADIGEIYILARAGEYNDTFFTLNYVSASVKSCDQAKKKLKAANL